jgi:VRR-NUC domain-containing protein
MNPLSVYSTSPFSFLLPSGKMVSIARCFHEFKRWEGPPVLDTYGGKAVLDSTGEPLFAELAILRLIRAQGWEGVWVDTYRKNFRQCWPNSCQLPPHAASFLERANAGRKWPAGCPDILAWTDGRHLFVEAKRRGKDVIRDTQRAWLESALNSGCPLESFLIFEWSISDVKPSRL